MKHTPGPWRADPRGEKWGVTYQYDYGDGPHSTVSVWLVLDGLSEIDARLIAAAPDLLEACRRLLRFNEELCQDVNVSTHYPSADFARKAIARAEGEL